MAQTVQYNPKTGAKLTKGQSVVVNDKTFTQGSSNLNGSTSPSSKTSTIAPGVTTKKVSGGSNKSSGGFTSANSSMTTSTKKTTPNQSTFKGSYADTNGSAINKDAINVSTPAPKKNFIQEVNSFFSNIFNKVGGQGASAFGALPSTNKTGKESMVFPVGTGMNPSQEQTAYRTLGSFADVPANYKPGTKNQTFPSDVPNMTYAKDSPIGYGTNGAPFTPATSNQSTPTVGSNSNRGSNKSSKTPTDTTAKTTTIDPVTGAETVVTQNITPPAPQANVTATANITGLTDGLLRDITPGNAWDKNQRGEFQDNKIVNYQSTTANMFNSPQDVDNSYNGDSVFRANIDKTAKATNKTPQDILNGIKAKVVPATNGVVPAQGTAQYLDLINTKNTPTALKAEADLLNKETVMTSQFNSEQDKLAHDILAQTKLDSQAIIDSITRKELSRETTLREKAQYLIDKEKAQWEMKDAEVEQNRILAKTNLTEFLAHIGALNTDGNAAVGIATLDQKYQAQRQALRSGFELATREIQMNMNSDINELESKMEDDVLKINMDLSKSEREVMLDSLKLRNSTNKAILEAQQKYATALRQEKDKQQAKAERLSNDWTTAYFTTAAGNNAADLFKSLPVEFRNHWLKEAPGWDAGGKGGKANLVDLSKDFANFQKNQQNTLQLTDTQKLKLSQQGVDVNQYVVDTGYREYVDSQLGE